MGLLCDCPLGTSIGNVPISTCPESMGQIQKIIVQRKFSTGTTQNKFSLPGTSPTLLASWTPLLSAADGTKIVQTPFIENPENEVGGKKEMGGGNATLGGIAKIIGTDPSKFTAIIYTSKQDTIKALKALRCEELGVYFVDEYGQMAGVCDDITNPAEVYPIPIKSLFVGDKKFGGFDGLDSNAIEFAMLPNWSDNFYLFKPTDFNPLEDLATPAS
jgi:hypothetical protein